ncbi:E6 [Peromyscus papillomavirus 1]|uniref:Protein E6 n=1 Tax=Peromyscus papillomavirus 1 TaxID=1074206 RepID=G1C9I3_9PAPI|nr:E6 [Peromyscus papillomavirus 1]AEM05816.1 E6 [Peromyscus papillomavirus 1]
MDGIITIDQLLQRLGIPRRDLLLPCTFCGTYLVHEDLLQFEHCCMRLIWRLGNVFACCRACAKVCASLEILQHFQGSFELEEVEQQTGQHIAAVPIRCRGCMKPLTYPEKLGVVERGEKFARVRNKWRGRCYLCKFMVR